MMKSLLLAATLLAAPAMAETPADRFMASLAKLCGQAFEGKVEASRPEGADKDFASQTMVMHVRDCAADSIRIPFHVGEDRSRTWVITRHGDRLRLKHDHRHKDGSEDELTQYGGDTTTPGTAIRQEFPADAFSKDLFTRTDRAVSVPNIWAVEVDAGRYTYELARPGRLLRVTFDTTRPVPTPPAPWGAEIPAKVAGQLP